MTDSPSIVPATVPSAKAMGKRAVANNLADTVTASRLDDAMLAVPDQAAATAPQKQGMQTRKRVLPSRSRRGGPGVGGCDVDVMILETRKRRLESEPLIPPSTKFVLTTNHALVPSSSSGEGSSDPELNTQAYSRYFDLPEVQAACRAQELIQTPEFTQLSDDALVGGRFRPRNSDEELVDTSDAAYEKRHRKYETFEKRQRLREKEKLKHEQYKLKERIEQLRAMETSSFLALPADNFSEPPGVLHEMDHDEAEAVAFDLPGAHVNGAAMYNEGERRRREMLDIAESLEMRYRVLLPPDRKWLEKKERLEREKREKASASASVEPEAEADVEDPAESEAVEPPDSVSVSVSTRSRRHKQDSDGESEVEPEPEPQPQPREKVRKLKLRIPPRPAGGAAVPESSTPPPPKKPHHNATITILSAPGVHISRTVRAADGRFLSKEKRLAIAAGESVSVPPRKRPRTASVDPIASPTKSMSSSDGPGRGRRPPPQCILLTAATRNAAMQNARKTQRHVTAFGVRVPPELEEIHDYELPYWLIHDEEDEDENEEEYENEEEDGEEHEVDGVDGDEAHLYHPDDAVASNIEWDADDGEDEVPLESD